eukprot:449997-Pyramimonas_sp.AAC.1
MSWRNLARLLLVRDAEHDRLAQGACMAIVEMAVDANARDLLNALERFGQPAPKCVRALVGAQSSAAVRRVVNGPFVVQAMREYWVPHFKRRPRT